MIRQIAPQFFTTDMAATLAYYKDTLGFDCVSTWDDPPAYAIVARDGHRIHFRLAEQRAANPDKYADELLDAYLFVENGNRCTRNMRRARSSSRGLSAARPWDTREFVVKDSAVISPDRFSNLGRGSSPRGYRLSGVRPVRLAIRASIPGPISSLS